MSRLAEIDPFEISSELDETSDLFDKGKYDFNLFLEFTDEDILELFDSKSDQDLLEEVDRKNHIYIKWVQRALNQIMNAGLKFMELWED